MAKLCGKRGISSDHLMWMAATINKEQSNAFCWVLNTVNDIERLVERRLHSHKPSNLVFFVSVAISTGKTLLASDHHQRIHWTLCQVEHTNKSVVYADTLGWQVPKEKVNRFINAVYREDITDYVPLWLSTISYPTCACGIIVNYSCYYYYYCHNCYYYQSLSSPLS